MGDLFLNKVAGAFLASALGLIVIGKFSNALNKPDVPAPKDFAYSLASEAETAPVAVAEVAFPGPVWLGARDAEKGAKVYKKCKACHTVDSGGKDGLGPHLWNVVGRPIGSVAGFGYSDSMRSKGGTWSYEALDEFLAKPKQFIPKTKMAFNGLKKETDRAALIEYLRLAADTPMTQLTQAVDDVEPLQEAVQEMGADPVLDVSVDTVEEVIAETVEDVVKPDAGADIEGGN